MNPQQFLTFNEYKSKKFETANAELKDVLRKERGALEQRLLKKYNVTDPIDLDPQSNTQYTQELATEWNAIKSKYQQNQQQNGAFQQYQQPQQGQQNQQQNNTQQPQQQQQNNQQYSNAFQQSQQPQQGQQNQRVMEARKNVTLEHTLLSSKYDEIQEEYVNDTISYLGKLMKAADDDETAKKDLAGLKSFLKKEKYLNPAQKQLMGKYTKKYGV